MNDSPAHDDLTGLVIAVIDDDQLGRTMMRRMLERRGCVVHEASNGSDGVELVRSRPFDAALVDVRMPGALSGLDVARELREDDVHVFLVSASARHDAEQMVDELGFAAFIEKPVDFTELFGHLAAIRPEQ